MVTSLDLSNSKVHFTVRHYMAIGGSGNYLLAVVGGVCNTQKVTVRPAIQVSVLPTDVPIASIARLALTAVHGVREDAQVDAVGMFVAVVSPVLARVTWHTHLARQSGKVRS